MARSTSFWRPMTRDDLAAVLAIADQVHADFPEDLAVFAERQRLYSAGAYILESQGEVRGYLLSHPWHSGDPPALNSLLGSLPELADTFYIHDLALLPSERGTGMAGTIIQQIAAHAKEQGFATISLVAVNDSNSFWQRFGFSADETPEGLWRARSYGEGARLMRRLLI